MSAKPILLFLTVALLLCIIGKTRISQVVPADFLAKVTPEEDEVIEPVPEDEYLWIDPDAFPDGFGNRFYDDVRFPRFLQESFGMPDDVDMMCAPICSYPNELADKIWDYDPDKYPPELGELTIGNLNGYPIVSKSKGQILFLRKGRSPYVESEAAVARSMAWLAKQQIVVDEKMGYWEFDGIQKDWRVAATGLTMLPYLAGGETHFPRPRKPRPKELEDVPESPRYDVHLARAMNYLLSRQKAHGGIVGLDGKVNMIEHGIATLALCELAGMVGEKDLKLKEAATLAAEFIVKAQAKDGSWGERPNQKGDTLTIAWQIQALEAAYVADLRITGAKQSLKKAEAFLNSVMTNTKEDFRFGLTKQGDGSDASTAAGTLCRMYLGWKRDTPALLNGVQHLKKNIPTLPSVDLLTQFYATVAMQFYGSPDWHKVWNPAMQRTFLRSQEKDGDNKGSWPPQFDGLGGEAGIGKQYGRLGTTCFSILILSVNLDRHLPLYKPEEAYTTPYEEYKWQTRKPARR